MHCREVSTVDSGGGLAITGLPRFLPPFPLFPPLPVAAGAGLTIDLDAAATRIGRLGCRDSK